MPVYFFSVEKGSKIEEQIIVGTPGKVLDWATKYRFFDANKIQVFVLDEADIMVDTQGHQDQSFRIRKLIKLIINAWIYFSKK